MEESRGRNKLQEEIIALTARENRQKTAEERKSRRVGKNHESLERIVAKKTPPNLCTSHPENVPHVGKKPG